MLALSPMVNPFSKTTVKGSQFETPLLEFSGACAGCGDASLKRQHPAVADSLFEQTEQDAKDRFERYRRLAEG